MKQITFVEWPAGSLFLSVVREQAASASTGSMLEMQSLRSLPVLLNQNLYFHEILRGSGPERMSQKNHCCMFPKEKANWHLDIPNGEGMVVSWAFLAVSSILEFPKGLILQWPWWEFFWKKCKDTILAGKLSKEAMHGPNSKSSNSPRLIPCSRALCCSYARPLCVRLWDGRLFLLLYCSNPSSKIHFCCIPKIWDPCLIIVLYFHLIFTS